MHLSWNQHVTWYMFPSSVVGSLGGRSERHRVGAIPTAAGGEAGNCRVGEGAPYSTISGAGVEAPSHCSFPGPRGRFPAHPGPPACLGGKEAETIRGPWGPGLKSWTGSGSGTDLLSCPGPYSGPEQEDSLMKMGEQHPRRSQCYTPSSRTPDHPPGQQLPCACSPDTSLQRREAVHVGRAAGFLSPF